MGKKLGFFWRFGNLSVREKSRVLATHNFLSCTQLSDRRNLIITDLILTDFVVA